MYEGPSKVKFVPGALTYLLDDPRGPTGRHLRKIGILIARSARKIAGRDTGELRRAIYVRQGTRGRYQYVQVGADVRHAYDHHEGTRRHTITPRTGRILRFNVGGKVVYARKVNHPGTRPRKYLTTPMIRYVKK